MLSCQNNFWCRGLHLETLVSFLYFLAQIVGNAENFPPETYLEDDGIIASKNRNFEVKAQYGNIFHFIIKYDELKVNIFNITDA